MFKNVLIAEDYESTSISVRKTLQDLGIPYPKFAYYCDDALKQVQNAIRDGEPYELLITDLSFEDDGTKQLLLDGHALVAAVKKAQPNLKVLVFSAEHKAAVIEGLFSGPGINGYVRKARNDAHELKDAIESIYKGKRHSPAHLRQAIKQKNAHNFTEYDITIILQLSQGMLQKDIPSFLKENGILPAGLSSIEKRLNLIKEALNFYKNEQLVAYCKDNGII